MTFEDMKEALPGSNIFYIQTNKDGELYINNRYSSFNREIKEQKTKKKILNLIKEFENGDKVQKLQEEVQENYDKIVSKDEKLEKKVNDVQKRSASGSNLTSLLKKSQRRSRRQKNSSQKRSKRRKSQSRISRRMMVAARVMALAIRMIMLLAG